MANKNIQIQDVQGNNLFPKTLGSVVFNNANENLGGVEAGAQVNIIETVKVDGVALTVADKAVNIELPVAAEYTIAKQETAEDGYAATYYLTKDNVQVGEKINIPKDMVVESGDLKVCEEDDKPVAGLKVGDPYIDLVIANANNQHIYIPVKDLVDVYTQGNGITITGHTIAIDDSVVVNHTEFAEELAKKVDANEAITAGTACKITYDAKGLVTGGAALAATDIPSLELTKISDVTATATELNQLHEAGAVKADFVKLHDITATAAEVNELHEAGAVKADFVKLHAITATADQINAITEVDADDLAKLADITASAEEINVLDGITATTAELNILDGVTADATEINVLDGITASTAELNYVKGVTSDIQGQFTAMDGAKADKATTLAGYGILDGLTYVELA